MRTAKAPMVSAGFLFKVNVAPGTCGLRRQRPATSCRVGIPRAYFAGLADLSVQGVLLTLMIAAASIAQVTGADSRGRGDGLSDAERNSPIDADTDAGLWPTKRQQELIVKRWARQLCQRHELTDDQRRVVERRFVSRWTDFLAEHEHKLRPLVNEMIELRIDVEPPSPERMRDWASRAKPIFDRVRSQFERMSEDVHDVMTPEQRATFELEMMAVGGGMDMAANVLEEWSQGRGDPALFWQPMGTREAERVAVRDVAPDTAQSSDFETKRSVTSAGVHSAPTDEVERELLAWARYVNDRANVLSFGKAQQAAAQSCLGELAGRARAHRDRYRAEIAQLEKRIATHSGENEQLESIRADLVRLYGPIDDMFAELKRRIDQLATAEQRATVRSPTEKGDTPKAGEDQWDAQPDERTNKPR